MACGVYQIKNKTNGKVYVGSSGHIAKRWWEHKKWLRLGCHVNPHLQASWDSYGGEDGFEWSILLEMETLEGARREEQLLIDKLWDNGKTCYNISKEVGKPDSEANKVAVNQLDKQTGVLVKTWAGIVDAATTLGLNDRNIINCCRGRVGSAGGFLWRYADPAIAIAFQIHSTDHGGHGKKKVFRIDPKTGKVVVVYESVASAASNLNVKASQISSVCAGKRKHAKGMLFSFTHPDHCATTTPVDSKAWCELCKVVVLTKDKRFATHLQFAHKTSSELYTIQFAHQGIRPKCLFSDCVNVTRYTSFSFKSYCFDHSFVAESNGGKQGGRKVSLSIAENMEERIVLDIVRLDRVKNHETPSIHLEKRAKAKSEDKKPYMLFFSDEIKKNKQLVESMIRSKLGDLQTKLNARSLSFDPNVLKAEAELFFVMNHISGNVPAKCYFGLRDPATKQLILCLSVRKPLQHPGSLEIARFASVQNAQVRGGLSKILKYVKVWAKTEGYTSIVTYAELRFGNGNAYRQVGFECVRENTGSNYWYTNGQKREFRFKYRASEGLSELEVAAKNKVYRVYGCGNALFDMKL